MINKITVKDFQSHENSVFVLSPGFNIIVGQSGSGKTALLRALSTLFYNNIQGTGTVRIDPRTNPKQYEVSVLLDNGYTIKRIKGSDINNYVLIDSNDNSKLLESVKVAVPSEVENIVNIKNVKIDADKEINIQYCGQFDPPFMLTEPGSAKMKFLNTLAGTYAVDMAIKEASAIVLNNQKKIKEYDADIKSVELERKTYANKVSALTVLNKEIEKEYATIEELVDVKDKFTELQMASCSLIAKFDKVKKVDALFSRVNIEAVEDLIQKMIVYKKLQDKSSRLIMQIERLDKKQKAFADINIDEELKKIDRYKSLLALKSKYNELLEKRNSIESKYKNVCADIDNLTAKYREFLRSSKVCPVCKQQISEDTLNKIII